MPFADVGGVVFAIVKGAGNAVAVEGQLDVVDEDAVGEGILAGHEASAKGTADEAATRPMCEIEAVPSELIKHGALAVGIAYVAGGLRAPFVSEKKHYVGLFHLAFGWK